MSLDVYLDGVASNGVGSGIFIREAGGIREITRAEWDERFPGREPVVVRVGSIESFHLNITHNLGPMATAAGIYDPLWRPEEVDITTARQLIEPLYAGLGRLLADPDRFRELNPPNGWGNYECLVRFVEQYAAACRANPDAHVRVWR